MTTLAELERQYPPDTSFGYAWFACPACQEPMLVQRGDHDHACVSTPRCKGKLNPAPVGPSRVRVRR